MPEPTPAETPSPNQVTQTIMYSPEDEARFVYGNCIQASVASYFGLPIEAVPHFATFEFWRAALNLWVSGRYGLLAVGSLTPPEPGTRCLLLGSSFRGVPHVVLGDGPEVIWDPHPSRSGLIRITGAVLFMTPEQDKQRQEASRG